MRPLYVAHRRCGALRRRLRRGRVPDRAQYLLSLRLPASLQLHLHRPSLRSPSYLPLLRLDAIQGLYFRAYAVHRDHAKMLPGLFPEAISKIVFRNVFRGNRV